MRKIIALLLAVFTGLALAGCPAGGAQAFKECKIQGLTLINAEADAESNGRVIREFSPVPPKIVLRLGELPTRKLMFLINFEPRDCADSIEGTVETENGQKSGLSKKAKPFVLLGFSRSSIVGNVKYTAGIMETGILKYELMPRFVNDSRRRDGEKLQFELEVTE